MARKSQLEARRRLATNARAARERLGWTQERAAEQIGCSVQQLRRVERAAVNTSLDLVAQLASVYRVDVQDLLAPIDKWEPRGVGRPAQGRAGSR